MNKQVPPIQAIDARRLRGMVRAGLVVLTLLASGVAQKAAAANPFVHQLFTNSMVLQRDASDPIWGWATAGNTVTVTVFDQNGASIQTATVVAGSDGRWQTSVGPFGLVPGNAAYSLTIASPGQTTVTLSDVLIGDVYLCSGQSNMDYTVNNMGGVPVYNAAAEIADSANYSKIRHFYVAHTSTTAPQQTLPSASWTVSGTATTGNFTATGYFTAREIYKQQGVPIGIICSAWAGSVIQLWLPQEFVSTFADYAQPLFDRAPGDSSISGGYNGMIAPIAPFRIKAVEWYQGEFNSSAPEQYSRLLPALMSSWRALFNQPSLPFLIVQLPNSSTYTGMREAQMNTVLNDSCSRVVSTLDIGENILHPLDKQDVGLRAAYAASDLIYGQSGLGQGPLFTGATISGSTIRCSFSDSGSGLMVGLKTINHSGPQTPVQQLVSGTLVGFKIAGSNGTYYTATATIDPADNTVVVSSTSVPNPVNVHYGWEYNAGCNLYRKITDASGNVLDGVPVSTFRTDPVPLLNVNGGAGSGYYAFGSQPAISGSSIAGETFDHWSGDTAYLSGTASSSVTASVSLMYESVLANYRITGAPTGLAGTPQQNQVTLNWSAMPLVHYNLKRANTIGGPFVTLAPNLSGTTPTYTDSSASPGVTYYYVVSAVGLMGEGPDSTPIATGALPGPPMNTAASSLNWDPLHTGSSSNGSGSWDNATSNFAASGTNVAYTPTPMAASNVLPFDIGATNITVSSASGLLPGLGISLSQFPAGTTISGMFGSTVTMSGSATSALTSTSAANFAPIHTAVFGSGSGSAGTIDVSGTQTANGMTINASGTGNYLFNGGAIRLGLNNGSSGQLTLNSSATVNSVLNLKHIYFNATGQSLTLGGGSSLLGFSNGVISGSNSSKASTSTLVMASGTYTTGGVVMWGIGDASAGTGGVVIQPGATFNQGSNNFIGYFGNGNSALANLNGGAWNVTSSSAGTILGRAYPGRLIIQSGTLNSVGVITVGMNSTGRLDLNGGLLVSSTTVAISSGSAGYGTMNITGGTALCATLNFGGGGYGGISGPGSGILNVTGGSLYLGAGGMINSGSGSFSASVTLSGGLVGATANWSSSLDMVLGTTNGNITFQAANAFATPFNLTFSGKLSGTGGLTKTGLGLLTLSSASPYSGATVISSGSLALASGGSISNSAMIDILAGASLDASALGSGLVLGGGQTLTGGGTLRGTLTAAGVVAPGDSAGTLSVTGAATLTGSLLVNVNGSSAGKLVANGNLNISGAALSVALLGACNGPYVIAQSNGGSLLGTFASVPAGYTVTYTSTQAILNNYSSWAASNGVSAADPNADSDGDGMTNYQEFLAGTNPVLAGSVLRINAITRSGNDLLVCFPSVLGKTYVLEKSLDLAAGSWSVALDNIPGNNTLVTVSDPGGALLSRVFYRVRVK